MTHILSGSLLGCGLFVLFSALAYRLWWTRRYPRPPVGLTRLRGRVSEIISGEGRVTLQLRCSDASLTTVSLDPDVHFVGGRPPRVGDLVTVDGLARMVPASSSETLYREQPLVAGIDAVRVASGTWPRLSWLVPAAGAASLVLCGVVVGSSTPAEWLIARTADKTVCPRDAQRETIVGPDGVIHRCRDDQGRLHGSFATWSWEGTAIERGSFLHGALQGTHDVRLADGTLQRSTYRRGLLHGPSMVLDDRQVPAHPLYHAEWASGELHGVHRTWHANGALASVRYYVHGRPHGTWSYWDEEGRKYAEGPPHAPRRTWSCPNLAALH